MSNGDRIAVIATVLNEAAHVPALIASLRTQSRQPDRVVIVDGGSGDGTWELLEREAAIYPALQPIRDESCQLSRSPGPIARGRNVAIAAAGCEVIACADAGCSYGPDWVEVLTAPIVSGRADLCLGGSCIAPAGRTLWDTVAAPFVGADLPGPNMPRTPTPTARSMAFRRDCWERVGGFSEKSLCGEDTEFVLRAAECSRVTFAPAGRALYSPRFTFGSALARIRRYAQADGTRGLVRARFARMAARAALGIGGVAFAASTSWPLAFALAVEASFAFRHDGPGLLRDGYAAAIPARMAFSVLVPWTYTLGYMEGAVMRRNQRNEQNQ